MMTGDREPGAVLAALSRWQACGLPARLVTVVQTYGSAPYEAGTVYALGPQGQEAGVLAGTCLGAWIKAHAGPVRDRRVAVIAADAADGLDLPCGGRLEFLIEDNPNAEHIGQWQTALAARTCIRRTVDMADGRPMLAMASSREPCRWTGRRWQGIYGPDWCLLLVGADVISAHLARIAQTLGFSVTVSEPRAEHRAAFPAGLGTITEAMPDDAVAALAPDARTAVVALAHDPRLDDLGLWAAAPTAAFYVAAMGSATTHARRCARLLSLGLDPAAVLRIQGPAGLVIHSRTPAEIAVSIAAALVSHRRCETHTEDPFHAT